MAGRSARISSLFPPDFQIELRFSRNNGWSLNHPSYEWTLSYSLLCFSCLHSFPDQTLKNASKLSMYPLPDVPLSLVLLCSIFLHAFSLCTGILSCKYFNYMLELKDLLPNYYTECLTVKISMMQKYYDYWTWMSQELIACATKLRRRQVERSYTKATTSV